MGILRIGETYRYARPFPKKDSQVIPKKVDGLENYFSRVHLLNYPSPLLEGGINQIAPIKTAEGTRYPAILISSSPHKGGSETTPWQDILDSDNGYARYYGDNKSTQAPQNAPGNKLLLDLFMQHNSSDYQVRLNAAPLLLFERVTVGSRKKGNLKFHGVAIMRSAELVTQYQAGIGYFTNYVFEFTILNLKSENEELDFDWINYRRDKSKSLLDALSMAPNAWRDWVENGHIHTDRNRRSVAKLLASPKNLQLPESGTREYKTLKEVYDFFTLGQKHHFELLASNITAQIVAESGSKYTAGWVTRASGDMGVDFVGRIDIGTGFAMTKIIVLGQAKCEQIGTPTNSRDLARTVARLKRGWIGSYVTTGYFSEKSQQEMFEDQYPLLTVGGLQVAQSVMKLVELNGFPTLKEYLIATQEGYETNLKHKRPEEILLA